jgi:hypothetical protein
MKENHQAPPESMETKIKIANHTLRVIITVELFVIEFSKKFQQSLKHNFYLKVSLFC